MEERKVLNANPAAAITHFVATYLMVRRHREDNYPDTDAQLGRAMQYIYDPKSNFPKVPDIELLVKQHQALFAPAMKAILENPKICGSLIGNSKNTVASLSVCLPYMANLAKEMLQISFHINQMNDQEFATTFGAIKSDKTGLTLSKSEVADVVARMYGFGIIQQLGATIARDFEIGLFDIKTRDMLYGQLCSVLNQATQQDIIWKNNLTACTSATKIDEAIKISNDIIGTLRLPEPGKANKIVGAGIGSDEPAKFGYLEKSKLGKMFDQTNRETSSMAAKPQEIKASISLPQTKEERAKVEMRQVKIGEELKSLAQKEKAKRPELGKQTEVIKDINLKTALELQQEISAIKEVLANGLQDKTQFEMLQDIAKDLNIDALMGSQSDESSLRLSAGDVQKFLEILQEQPEFTTVEINKAADAADELRGLAFTDSDLSARADQAADALRQMNFGSSSSRIIFKTEGSATDSRQIREALRESAGENKHSNTDSEKSSLSSSQSKSKEVEDESSKSHDDRSTKRTLK